MHVFHAYHAYWELKVVEENLHRPGIEPGPPAWQASILPLNHRCEHMKLDPLSHSQVSAYHMDLARMSPTS